MDLPRTPRYEIIGSIGVGGAGEVFLAGDTRLGRAVALKRLLPEAGAPAGQAYAHALREATHLAALQHPHIVSVYDVGEDERGPYLVMELVEGDTLEEAVGRGPFPLGDFLLLARQSLDALAAAHRVGLLHRDLKPSNVMLKRGVAGESFEVKLLDFGLSGFSWRDDAAQGPGDGVEGEDPVVYGSVHFMAPEQFTRERPPDARTDLYALGCLFYYALTAAYPVEGDTVGVVVERHLRGDVPGLAARCPEAPAALCAWVMRLLAPRPEDRPESAAHALGELQAWRETASDPRPATARLLAPRPTARSKLPAVLSTLDTLSTLPVTLPVAPPRWRLPVLVGVSIVLGIVAGATWRKESYSNATALLSVVAAPREPALVVAATDGATLHANVGAEVVAEGRLLALEPGAERTVRTLRFEPGTDGSALALVFFPGTVSPGPSGDGLQGYVGHRVRARGLLSEYRGTLQIIIRDAAEIEAMY